MLCRLHKKSSYRIPGDTTLLYSIVIGFGIYLWNNVLKTSWIRILMVVLFLFAWTPDAAREAGEVILSWMQLILLLVLFTFLAVRYLRNNSLLYFAAIFVVMIFRSCFSLIEATSTVYAYHGAFVLILGMFVLLWLVSGKERRV